MGAVFPEKFLNHGHYTSPTLSNLHSLAHNKLEPFRVYFSIMKFNSYCKESSLPQTLALLFMYLLQD